MEAGELWLRLVSPLSPSADARLQDEMAAKQPPPLMKKHSQTDLVSRLKTRKILGVGGEDDDGEVHRSKVGRGASSWPPPGEAVRPACGRRVAAACRASSAPGLSSRFSRNLMEMSRE